MRQSFGHIAAAVAETDVAWLVIDGARKEKNPSFADKAFAEGLNVLRGLEASEADGAGVGRGPLKQIGVSRKEGAELRQIA